MKKKGKYNQRNQQQQGGKKKNFIITQQHLMDKTHMQPTQYLPFLYQDSLYPPFNITQDQQLVLRTILKQLNYILYVDFKVFWATILYNPSFKICIHSCIRFFHRKWLNQYINKSKQEVDKQNVQLYQKVKQSSAYQYTQHLYRIVLLIFFRIVHFQEQNPELSNLYHLKTQIIGKYILDIPRLLEIIEIYGQTNQDIVKIIVKQFVNLSTTLYSDFVQEIMQPMIARIGKSLGAIKKTTDREEFGIQYNYKRTIQGQQSAGEIQLKKKIMVLLQIISFYETLKNIFAFFPSAWSQYTKFNIQIHTISQNIFIQIEQAYKTWHTHDKPQFLYPLMNKILKFVIQYYVQFLQKCEALFVDKSIKSNFKQAYMKCLDRMLQHYGKRTSLGKKGSLQKKYMDMYRQILKVYKIDQFLQKLYMDEVQNNTYGINMDFLVDFKIAIDQLVAKMQGRPLVPFEMQEQQLQKTQADKNQEQDPQLIPIRKYSQKSQIPETIVRQSSTAKQLEDLSNLQMMISKRNRQDNYYEKLYKDYRAKITIQYEDQYDDLIDYQKRPMFEDNNKQQQDSSDASSGQEYDGQLQQLHLVKSKSNVNRQRGLGAQHHYHQKYDRKNKAKFIPVKQAEAKAVISRQTNKYPTYSNSNKQKERPTYTAKQTQKIEEKPNKQTQKSAKQKEYNDEQCYQECRQKIKQQKKQRQKQEVQQLKKQAQNKKKTQVEQQFSDQQQRKDDNRNRDGKRGGRGGHYNNYNNNKQSKGSNTNKKKYVQKN